MLWHFVKHWLYINILPSTNNFFLHGGELPAIFSLLLSCRTRDSRWEISYLKIPLMCGLISSPKSYLKNSELSGELLLTSSAASQSPPSTIWCRFTESLQYFSCNINGAGGRGSGLHTAPDPLLWKPLMGIVYTAAAWVTALKTASLSTSCLYPLSVWPMLRNLSFFLADIKRWWLAGWLLMWRHCDFSILSSGIHTSLNICCLPAFGLSPRIHPWKTWISWLTAAPKVGMNKTVTAAAKLKSKAILVVVNGLRGVVMMMMGKWRWWQRRWEWS